MTGRKRIFGRKCDAYTILTIQVVKSETEYPDKNQLIF